MVLDDVEDNYYARFDIHCYQPYKETHLNATQHKKLTKFTEEQNLGEGHKVIVYA